MEPVEATTETPAAAPATTTYSGDFVTLETSDGKMYKVPVEIAKMSETIKNLIEDAGIDNPIPLPNVNSKSLELTIEYCKYHYENPTVVTEEANDAKDAKEAKEGEKVEKRTDNMSPWDADFTKRIPTQEDLFALILASNYLDIKDLLDVTCQAVANMVKGKTPEEIRKTFNIDKEFTPEEEEQVRKENEWCEER